MPCLLLPFEDPPLTDPPLEGPLLPFIGAMTLQKDLVILNRSGSLLDLARRCALSTAAGLICPAYATSQVCQDPACTSQAEQARGRRRLPCQSRRLSQPSTAEDITCNPRPEVSIAAMSSNRLFRFPKPKWLNSATTRTAGVYLAGAMVRARDSLLVNARICMC